MTHNQILELAVITPFSYEDIKYLVDHLPDDDKNPNRVLLCLNKITANGRGVHWFIETGLTIDALIG